MGEKLSFPRTRKTTVLRQGFWPLKGLRRRLCTTTVVVKVCREEPRSPSERSLHAYIAGEKKHAQVLSERMRWDFLISRSAQKMMMKRSDLELL